MRKIIKYHWAFILLFLLLAIFLFQGINNIPFHPDESTYLYMSEDLDIYLRNPFRLSFHIQEDDDPRQRYRLIDPPLTRYVIGISRKIVRTPTIENDWDWSKTWEENRKNQAMPNKNLLYTGRVALTIFLLISIILIYIIGSYIGGRTSGIAAAVFLGVNALALLHGRRAMAEGILIFGITLLLVSLIYSTKLPWLTGVGMAIALNSKHSTFLLFFVGLIAVSWFTEKTSNQRVKIIRNLSLYVGSFVLITIVLNPVFWSQPSKALQVALFERQQLLTQQVEDMRLLMPDRVLDSLGKKTVAQIANLFILPPSVADVGNYIDNTKDSEEVYLSNPMNTLLRGLIGGGFSMVLTLLGITLAGIQIPGLSPQKRKVPILFLLATGIQICGLIIFVPLPWQRYVIPLVPFVCIWAGNGLGCTIALITNTLSNLNFNQNRGTH